VSAGTLIVVGSGTLGSANGSLTVNTGGTLDLHGTNQTIGNFTGTGGTILNNATGTNVTLTIGSGNGTGGNFAGVIANNSSGTGTVALTKIGTGTQTLSGANTYTGATTINAGTLALSGTGSVADSSGVDLTASGATFDISAAAGNETINDLAGVAGSTVNLGAKGLTEGTANSTTFAGVIEGTGGSLTKVGAGTLTLSGANTYSGGTTITAGTLQIGNGTSSNGSIGTGGVTDSAALVFDPFSISTIANAITGGGTVTQNGPGTTILTNTGNTYSGGTTITAGTLQIGDGATSNGSVGTTGILDNAALVFDPMASSTSTIGNAITGNGTVTQNGPGKTILTNTSNNYLGNTTVSAGTLQIGNGSSGTINDGSAVFVSSGATLAFDEATGLTQSNTITDSGTVAGVEGGGITNTLSGNITGGGVFTQTGTGTTVLSGDNGYTGGTTISAGTLVAGSANALGATTNSLTDNATLDLDGNSVTVGAFNGSGTVTNNGGADSTLTVSGGGDFTGGIEDGSTNTTALTLTGGTLVLSGASSYSGGTTINSGTLLVGSATALGDGSVTNNGGILGSASTNPNHVINVATNYTQGAGGTLDITLRSDPVVANTNDLLSVGGTASLNGNLDIIVIPSGAFTPTKGDSFTVVEANTASPSTPDGITSAGAGFTTAIESAPGLIFTGAVANSNNDLIVTIMSTQLALTSIPGVVYTPNQAAVANYISEFITSGPLFNALANIVTNNPQDLPGIQDQLSPEKFGNFAISTVINNAAFSTQMLDSYFESQHSRNGDFGPSNGQIDSSGLTVVDPSMDPGLAQISSRLLAWSPAPLSHGLLSDSGNPVTAGIDMGDMKPTTAPDKGYDYDVFVMGNAVLAQDFSQADVPHADTTTGAVQIGADYRITPHLRVGAIFGYGHTDANLDDIGSKATVDSYAPGAFISYAQAGWYFNALGSYGFDNFTEDRSVSFPGFSGIAHGAPNGDQIVGNLDGGYDFHRKNWTFGPLVGVQYTHMDVDSYTEGGSDPVDLQVDKVETDSLRSRLGGHVSYVFQTGKVLLTPHLDASWQHEFMNQSQGITSQFTSVGVGSFTINTPQPSRDSALIDGGLSADLNGQVSLYLDYLVQAGQSNYFGQAVQAGVKVGF
jgi:autotransporter-associated beta strand protein